MTKLDRTARFFRRHRRRWVSAFALMHVGGWLRWRTSVSECRTLLGMQIENKLTYTKAGTCKSFYRYTGKKVA